MVHVTEGGTLDQAEDGFYYPVCLCGWSSGPFPDLETTVDALMEHAGKP